MSTAPELSPNGTDSQSVLKKITYVVSDVHLTTSMAGLPHSDHFLRFLKDLNAEQRPCCECTLVLNGDVFDVTGSWQEDCLPWDSDHERADQALQSVLAGILAQHSEIVGELRAFLQKGHQMAYLTGNHDRLIGQSLGARVLLREVLCPDGRHSENLHIDTRYECRDLGLYVEHGQRFDPFNLASDRTHPPLGDAINILIVNRFVSLVLQKMSEAGYSPEICLQLRQVLHQIEYLRPLSLGPFWLKTVQRQYADHPESLKADYPIDRIIDQVIRETLLSPQLLVLVSRQLRIPQLLIRALLKALLDCPCCCPRCHS